ncbi:hypothetical protein [Nonomuraea helvata]|uniref:hypothetical protein n=1 Tax=Nonomuraea helvata TaxID=37484 RepID=UPI0031F1B4F8
MGKIVRTTASPFGRGLAGDKLVHDGVDLAAAENSSIAATNSSIGSPGKRPKSPLPRSPAERLTSGDRWR